MSDKPPDRIVIRDDHRWSVTIGDNPEQDTHFRITPAREAAEELRAFIDRTTWKQRGTRGPTLCRSCAGEFPAHRVDCVRGDLLARTKKEEADAAE